MVPGLLLGLAPIVFVEWLTVVTDKLASLVIGLWSLLILASLIALGWFGWRALFRMAEKNFWALNSIVVEPSYAAFREAFRQLAERLFARNASDARRAKLRAASAAVAGILVCGLALLVLWLVWPHTHLYRQHLGDRLPGRRSLWWRSPTASPRSPPISPSPRWSGASPMPPWRSRAISTNSTRRRSKGRTWRIAHLSDIHVVGERYGFRIESGRSGPRGNERLKRLLKQLEALDAKDRSTRSSSPAT